jgi:hypothetical protein
MNNDALKYDVREICSGGNLQHQLVWRDSEGKIGDVIAGSALETILRQIAKNLNRHTRDDEVLLNGASDEIIRRVMAERDLTYYGAVQRIFSSGLNVEGGTGSIGFDYSVEHADFPGQTIHLSFESVDNPTDENVWIQIKGEEGSTIYDHALPLNWIVDRAFKKDDPKWQSVAYENATDHGVFIQFEDPEDGFHEALGEIGRKHNGSDCDGSDCCTWIFNTEEEAMSYMAEAAPVAAQYSGDGSFEIDYTKA